MSGSATSTLTRDRLPWIALAVGATAAATAAVTVLELSPLLAAAGGIGAIAAIAILRHPFLGVLLLVGTVQQIGWGRLILPGLIGVTDILTALTVAGIAFEKRREDRPGPRLPEDLALRLVAILGLLIMLSAAFVGRKGGVFLETQKLIGYLVLLLLTVHQATTTRRVRALVVALMVSTAVSSGVALSDHYLGTRLAGLSASDSQGPTQRQTGSGGGWADNSAKTMASGGAVAAILFLRDRRLRWLTGSSAILMMAAVPTTAGRAAMLALGLGFAWLVFKYRGHRRFGAVLLLAPIVLLVAIAFVPSHTWYRLSRLMEPSQDPTTVLRLAMYDVGFDVFKTSPLLGVGPSRFEREWLDFEYRWVRPEDIPKVLHNTYLAVMVEFGIFALITFLSLLWVTWRGLRWAAEHAADPQQRWLAEAMEFALVLYLLQANTGAGHRQMFLWLLIGVSLAVARTARVQAGSEKVLSSGLPAVPLSAPPAPA